MKNTLFGLGGILILAGGIYFAFVNSGPSRDEIVFAANYQAYETSKQTISSDKITVLNFYAPRCPSCRMAHKNILSEVNQIPANIQILNVDYDTNTDLRQKYGVTSQHTFVLVDTQGNIVKKTQGLNHVSEIIAFVGDYVSLPVVSPVDTLSTPVDTTLSGVDTTLPITTESKIVTEVQSPTPSEITTSTAGIYTDYESDKKYISDPNKRVVLFFHASRCPSCKAAEKDIIANKDSIDPNLVILKVDYDTANDLKKQYGITSQTSYVVVNADGSLNKKSAGMTSLDAIEKFVQ